MDRDNHKHGSGYWSGICWPFENENLSEIFYQAYANPESLSGSSLDRVQGLMLLQHNNFRRVFIQYEAGLLPDDTYEHERRAVGYIISVHHRKEARACPALSGISQEVLWSVVSGAW